MGRHVKPKLTIIEGKWFPKHNVSVQEIARPLVTVWSSKGPTKAGGTLRPDRYHYEMFTTEDALKQAVGYAFDNGRPNVIYVAAHGSTTALQGFHQSTPVSRTVIKNSINQNKGTTPRGLLFGACLFGTTSNAKWFLSKCKRLAWVAGYTEEVDWVEATLLDFFFLSYCIYAPKEHRTLAQRVRYAADRVQFYMDGLTKKLEFHIYVREKGSGSKGKIRDLLNYTKK